MECEPKKTLQFVIQIRTISDAMNTERAAAAEFALKAYSVESAPSEFDLEDSLIKQIAESVDLTEAPEDAVCSLVDRSDALLQARER